MGLDYCREYENKRVSPEQAVRVVKSGDWVAYSHFAMFPRSLDRALAQRKEALTDVKVRASCALYEAEVAKVEPAYEHFIYHSSFLSHADRALGDRCMHLPEMYRDGPIIVRSGDGGPLNVALIMTTAMDEHGYFNFGTSCSYQRALCDQADVIVVEVNKSAPVCLGGEQENLHISEVAYVVETDDAPLPVLPSDIPTTDVEKAIAAFIVEEMEDRCTLQLGIGALANCIGTIIADSDLKDLGMHSEMMCDAFVDLYERGLITGKYKNIDKYKMTYTFAMGSKRLYEFLDKNPACATYPVDMVNDPERIKLNDKQISVNNALMVDLYGQVCSEAIDFKQVSGTGGQVDFISGSLLSKGGKAFICLPSTRRLKDGRVISRITPYMPPGAIVTDARTLPMFIVTEYGKVNLMGKSVWKRAEQLISIAHPDFRDELIGAAEKQKIWTKSNKIA